MKKIIGMILLLCAVFLVIPVMANGGDETIPCVTVSCPNEISEGEEIIVAVSLENAQAYGAISFQIRYDDTMFTPVEIVYGSAFSSALKQKNLHYSDNAVFVSFTYGSNVAVNGELVRIRFSVKETVAGKTAFLVNALKFKDENADNIPITSQGAETDVICMHDNMSCTVLQPATAHDIGLECSVCPCGHMEYRYIPRLIALSIDDAVVCDANGTCLTVIPENDYFVRVTVSGNDYSWPFALFLAAYDKSGRLCELSVLDDCVLQNDAGVWSFPVSNSTAIIGKFKVFAFLNEEEPIPIAQSYEVKI